MNRLLGVLSCVGRSRKLASGPLRERLLRQSRVERTYPVVCRNLGLPCELAPSIMAVQLLARAQAEEILRDVEGVPLKGLDLAWSAYPSPSLRDMGDVDLLVRPSERGKADEILRRLGYAPELPPEALDGGTLHAALYSREASLPIHLHWHPLNSSWPQFMFRLDPEELWAGVRGGRLDPLHRFLLLAEHALKHSYGELIHLTDLELASRGLDGAAVAELAARWGLSGPLFYACRLLEDLMEARPWRLALPEPGWEGKLFLALTRRHRWDGLSGLGLLGLARGSRGRFLREVLAPGERGSRGYRSRTVGKRLLRSAELIWKGLTSPAPRPAR
jgi:hypothetical protein